ncbi:ATP-binding cassette domain-containing protein [Mucilaginibacter sp. RS28]|uniref:ATP-binding cassette domain-containing protein n=1 Tax=Mucilaginibacter straminoryzae TaxID=2932774 RepID=A0A9X1X630_9SPHI|nr:ATP-binding cassette domain-containing protein [Mucilaginibacter straminoryzae]MCJ8210790.1 ATP-binding cassette domain-containing protein [Mucilaginibacter straminoryzae]
MVIRTEELSFNFGNQQVVKSLSLNVPSNSIYGFLGPNGAGKTTTIKMLLNLLKTQYGSIYIFEQELNKNRVQILSQIGSLIEQPAIYSHLTGKENLLNRAMLVQVAKNRVDDILKLVQLDHAADKKAGKYSLGMKQRLGIGLALLADPKLLILDEPTNGLDPNGIIEMRELLIDLVRNHDKTVFVSSHLLSEVEKMATHVGIINHGELLFQGSITELRDVSKPLIHIETEDNVAAANFLMKQNIIPVEVKDEGILAPYISREDMGRVNSLLTGNGYQVYSICKQQKDLEKLFLDITKKAQA